ncbi:hypothetical protein AMTR_s00033p00024200 [Amborella trichopoda]|uniref:Transmembrane protein n=1 Tax=Amborella trichopoda TaxID=13333 RepID=U5CW54_AMBTC|nr:hypothetical protein AMTR_s00033p00024200 [Amborella trichopoda]
MNTKLSRLEVALHNAMNLTPVPDDDDRDDDRNSASSASPCSCTHSCQNNNFVIGEFAGFRGEGARELTMRDCRGVSEKLGFFYSGGDRKAYLWIFIIGVVFGFMYARFLPPYNKEKFIPT